MKVYQDQFGMVRPVPAAAFVNGSTPLSFQALFRHCANGKESVRYDVWEKEVKPLIVLHGLEDDISLISQEELLVLISSGGIAE